MKFSIKISTILSLILINDSQSFSPCSIIKAPLSSSSSCSNTQLSSLSDAIMDDCQRSLLLLVKHVEGGPGSLTLNEVQDLERATKNIIQDMKSVGTTASAPVSNPNQPLPPAAGPASYDHNTEEGEEYDGTGGFGLAKGTTNTYIIDGMDEMTPEEYRAALQETISERQRQRSSGKIVGNRSSNNYLDNLNK